MILNYLKSARWFDAPQFTDLLYGGSQDSKTKNETDSLKRISIIYFLFAFSSLYGQVASRSVEFACRNHICSNKRVKKVKTFCNVHRAGSLAKVSFQGRHFLELRIYYIVSQKLCLRSVYQQLISYSREYTRSCVVILRADLTGVGFVISQIQQHRIVVVITHQSFFDVGTYGSTGSFSLVWGGLYFAHLTHRYGDCSCRSNFSRFCFDQMYSKDLTFVWLDACIWRCSFETNRR